MLIDVKPNPDELWEKIFGDEAQRMKTGVYRLNHFNGHLWLKDLLVEPEYEIEKRLINNLHFERCTFGVSDNLEQVLEYFKPEIDVEDRYYVITLTCVEKRVPPEPGGWRWHKWGPYIGIHEPTMEYLDYEPLIDKVECFHIYEVIRK